MLENKKSRKNGENIFTEKGGIEYYGDNKKSRKGRHRIYIFLNQVQKNYGEYKKRKHKKMERLKIEKKDSILYTIYVS